MPLDPIALEDLFNKLGLPHAGRDMVRSVRTKGPIRRVLGNRAVIRRYASRKMERTIQCESRTLEAPACVDYERRHEVLEFHDQPFELVLDYVRSGSNRRATRHVVDFLVIEGGWIGFEEWKTESWLEARSLAEPERYIRSADGRWSSPPADRAAAKVGLGYRLRTEKDLNAIVIRNFTILDGARGAWTPHRDAIVGLIGDVPGASLAAVLETAPAATVDEVFSLIEEGTIWTDLERALLTEHLNVLLFPTAKQGRLLLTPIAPPTTGELVLEPGTDLLWNGNPWRVANCGVDALTLIDAEGRAQPLRRDAAVALAQAGELRTSARPRRSRAELLAEMGVTPPQIDAATRRFAAIEPFLVSGASPAHRSLRRWIERYRAAQTALGDGLLGLVDRYHTVVRGRRVSADALAIAHEVIDELVLTPDRRPAHFAYAIYENRCAARGFRAISRPTFRAEIQRVGHERAARRRYGRKVGNAETLPRPMGTLVLPVHGDRAFERVHIDHTKLDLELVDSANREPLGRPWLTLAIDAYTRRIVGHVVGFDAPSAAGVMLVLRSIGSRFNRVGQVLVLDNGPEFHSVYMQATAAALRVSIEYRPPSNPRFGSVIETCFGKLNERFVHFLRGNTLGRKDVRSQDPFYDAEHRAVWTLTAFEETLERYLYEVYDNERSTLTGLSPREAFEKSVRDAGTAPADHIDAASFDFRVITAPPAKRPKVTVTRQGTKIQQLRYWCDAFARPRVIGTKVEVRVEPFDRSRAYALVEGQWHEVTCDRAKLLMGRTDREIRLVSVELTQRLRRAPSTRELAAHLEQALATESRLLAERRAAEHARTPGKRHRALESVQASRPAAAPSAIDPIDDEEPRELDAWQVVEGAA